MSIITRMLKGKCVYWAPLGVDKFGQTTFSPPVEIKCRWEDTQKEYIDSQGRTSTSSAIVYVDRDIELKGVLWDGLLVNVTNLTNPFQNSGSVEIKQFGELPNFKQTEVLRTAIL